MSYHNLSVGTENIAKVGIAPLRVVVLASGSGSNLQVLINAMQAGTLPIDIVGVISNREDAYAITRAKMLTFLLPSFHIPIVVNV